MKSNDFALMLGYTNLITGFILFMSAFLLAYLQGGETVVDINKFGEANIELWMLLFLFPFSMYAMLHAVRNVKSIK